MSANANEANVIEPPPPVKPKLRLELDAPHTVYRTRDGVRVPSVTTVLGMLDKPALLWWAWDLGRKGEDYRKVKQRAADVGTVAHGLCEAYLRGMELDTSNLVPEVVAQAQVSFERFRKWWDAQGYTVLHNELPLVSEKWRVGGTLDVMAQDREGNLVLVDLKTSRRVYFEMQLQVSAYAAIYEEVTSGPVSELFIVRIGKAEQEDDAGFEVVPVKGREKKAAAFAALARAREKLLQAGMKL